jgi:uncharacterized protein (DUF58 family)
MRPALNLLLLATGFLVAGVVLAVVPGWEIVFLVAAAVAVFAIVLDGVLFLTQPGIRFERKLPARFALQQETEVSFTLYNDGVMPLRIRFFDGLPEACRYEELPFEAIRLRGKKYFQSAYRVTFLQRDDLTIDRAYVEVRSPFTLWWRVRRVGEAAEVRIFPNYVPALNYGLLATADRAELMGIIRPRNRGMSKEFHQLRDYQEGDALSQIDWKATSRFNSLITREYQEERDQTILLVPDCSMRASVNDGGLPLLDHLLNAAILLSYIALGQGDKVGVMSFGGDERYLAPVKGTQGMAAILNHLYNYQPTRNYGDYSELVTRVLSRQRKRCLVVVLTNLRTENRFDALSSLKLLTKQHLVMLASVRESSVESALTKEVRQVGDAQRFLGALAYQQDLDEILNEARGVGLSAVHESLDLFPVAVANQFLDLRASGRF